MFLFLWIICTAFVVMVFDLILQRLRLSFYVKNLPTIPLKVVLPLLRPNVTTTEIFQIDEKATNMHDGLTATWIFAQLLVICDDPVNLRTILMSKDCFGKPHNYRLIPAIANGILFSEGESHDE